MGNNYTVNQDRSNGMKTAEQWFNEYWPYLAEQRKRFGKDFHQDKIDFIKAIQDDAIKQHNENTKQSTVAHTSHRRMY